MTALQWPCTLFETQKRMDDYNAPDMQYGDLTQEQLKKDFLLTKVSERVDPFALTKIGGLSRPLSMFAGSRGEGEKISPQECARILLGITNTILLIEKMNYEKQYLQGSCLNLIGFRIFLMV